MIVPALTAYHEASAKDESFPMPLPLLAEYGIFQIYGKPLFNTDVKKLHHYYPNLSRISVRFGPSNVKAFVHSLSRQSTSLPMLKILAVKVPPGDKDFSSEDKASMMDDVFTRNTATGVEMELCFDGVRRAPLYFGVVRVYIKEGQRKLTTTLRIRIHVIEDPTVILAHNFDRTTYRSVGAQALCLHAPRMVVLFYLTLTSERSSLAEPCSFRGSTEEACLIIAAQGPVRLRVNFGDSPRFKNMERHLEICTTSTAIIRLVPQILVRKYETKRKAVLNTIIANGR